MTTSYDGNFQTELDIDFLHAVLSAGEAIGIDPLSSIEAEAYFLKLQQKVRRQEVEIEGIQKIIEQDFICLSDAPLWIQSDEWQYEDLEPMIFVGQINAPEGSIVGNKSFYVFQSKNSNDTKVVVQVD